MEFLILGPVEARADGRVIDLGGPKAQAFLAALPLHANRPVAAERLAMALAEAGRLSTTSGAYVLRVDASELDVLRSRGLAESARGHLARWECARAASRLRTARTLWRGTPLADVALFRDGAARLSSVPPPG